MNLEAMSAVDAGLDAARYFLRICFLPVLALRADNNEHHAYNKEKPAYKSYARMSSAQNSSSE